MFVERANAANLLLLKLISSLRFSSRENQLFKQNQDNFAISGVSVIQLIYLLNLFKFESKDIDINKNNSFIC